MDVTTALFQAEAALAGILVGAVLIVAGFAEAARKETTRLEGFYRWLVRWFGSLAAVSLISVGLGLASVLGSISSVFGMAIFSLCLLGLLIGLLTLVLRD